MPIEVLIGTAIAVLLLFVRAIGPHEWQHPTKWRVPEAGPSLFVWFGANALTAAVRLGVILIGGKVGLRGMKLDGNLHEFNKLGADDGTVLLGGAVAAFLVGLATIREGMRGVVPLRSTETTRAASAQVPVRTAEPSDQPQVEP